MAEQLRTYQTYLLFISRLGTCCSQCKRPPGPCPWLLDLPAKYAATAEDRPLTVDEKADETVSLTGNDKDHEKFLSPLKKHTAKRPRTLNQVPEILFINSFTPLDQATNMQTDDSPTTQKRMPPVMVNIEDQNAKNITKLIGLEFGNRLILKFAPKHLKCTALDNQSYQDLISYLQNNELNFYKTTPKSMRSLRWAQRVTS
ncbi:hypothetical protein CDAR_431881 [Caerostris darwini]|uniref:Uncharacterized protein n=1 Tax=Caerostris darwini TaxID=1538125 RepID=A0AAV4UK40_9ARAC|nr:hypothetical protein CDAR_431881 [Caerostris darwini]